MANVDMADINHNVRNSHSHIHVAPMADFKDLPSQFLAMHDEDEMPESEQASCAATLRNATGVPEYLRTFWEMTALDGGYYHRKYSIWDVVEVSDQKMLESFENLLTPNDWNDGEYKILAQLSEMDSKRIVVNHPEVNKKAITAAIINNMWEVKVRVMVVGANAIVLDWFLDELLKRYPSLKKDTLRPQEDSHRKKWNSNSSCPRYYNGDGNPPLPVSQWDLRDLTDLCRLYHQLGPEQFDLYPFLDVYTQAKMIHAARTASMPLPGRRSASVDSLDFGPEYFRSFEELRRYLGENGSEPDVSAWDDSYRQRFFQVYETCREFLIKRSRICMTTIAHAIDGDLKQSWGSVTHEAEEGPILLVTLGTNMIGHRSLWPLLINVPWGKRIHGWLQVGEGRWDW